MREQLPILRSYDGLVYSKLARRLEGDSERIVLFEEWRDPSAMYAWTGPNPERARLMPGAEELITDLEITHYEALDVETIVKLGRALRVPPAQLLAGVS